MRKKRNTRKTITTKLVPASHPDADSEHVLLADEALDVSVLVNLEDLLGEGGVLHVAVQGHHPGVGGGELGQGRAIGLPGGQGLAQLVGLGEEEGHEGRGQ